MADLIIKPSSGNSLVLQDEGGDAALTVGTTGSTTLAGTGNNIGTVTAGTLSHGTTLQGWVDASNTGVTFPVGHIIQVVYVQNTTDTLITTATNFLSASITPRKDSHKILLTAHMPGVANRGSSVSEGFTKFVRGSTDIATIDGITPWKGDSPQGSISLGSMSASYLDSPSTTSSITYHINVSGSSGGFKINNEGGTSTLTLMEIVE
tara:strand:+ start:299 stop:919 length:621 start_codon:yes stop_codon:yes gene_type:complete